MKKESKMKKLTYKEKYQKIRRSFSIVSIVFIITLFIFLYHASISYSTVHSLEKENQEYEDYIEYTFNREIYYANFLNETMNLSVQEINEDFLVDYAKCLERESCKKYIK